ncbi:MAG: type I DNA topoisomerase [Candidatus Levybacteria bacterium]|nr:type I DNA topoisomerase [Candidatus Levybacteria bacterium]
MKTLVIVESPTKARTIGKFLGKDFEIIASMGHIMDLPKSKIGIDFENNFQPQYELVADKGKIIGELKTAAKTADTIILATDPDREGEAIASHIADMLRSNSKLQRIVFHEITKEAIEEAFKNPRDIDVNLVDAQTARRVLDRLVGYKLSPLLWRKVRRGLSAGRVQSVALRLIVEREREIGKFGKEKYWTIAVFLVRSTEFELIEINGVKIEAQKTFNLYDGEYSVTKTSIITEAQALEIKNDLGKQQFTVSDVLQKETKRSPAPPFTTSTLQQEASRRFGFSGKRTMGLAQKLYEEGFITYHRTDSFNLSTASVSGMRNFIGKEYGDKYLPESPRFYKTKQKLAQEAHEAIRPTKFTELAKIKPEISAFGNDHFRLYELIWKRAIACQMADAAIESTTVLVNTLNNYRLKANGSVLVFDGFLKVHSQVLNDNILPKFIANEKLDFVSSEMAEHETLPPPRYNDASLIKTLEEKGIGRPSTYATIVSTIETRRYIERIEGRFTPTNVGIAVNDFLVKNFSDIDDIPFTASMEEGLDEIAKGEKKWVPIIRDFYTPFEKKLEEVKDADRVKIAVEETNEKCPECGAPLVIRIGRFGKFISCSEFPKCKFTKSFVETTDLLCPKDGKQIVIKRTKRGRRFYGCSNYPKCDFAAWKVEDIKKVSAPRLSVEEAK